MDVVVTFTGTVFLPPPEKFVQFFSVKQNAKRNQRAARFRVFNDKTQPSLTVLTLFLL